MDDSGSCEPGDDLLAEVAHELTNPLSIAHGFARRLLDTDDLDGDGRRAVQAIDRNLKIAMHLLNTYRDATRGDEPITLDLAWVPVAQLVDSTVEDLDALLDGHDVEVHHQDAELEVLADESRIRQALFNLLSNAAKHTPPGTVVHVRTWSDGDEVTVEVADEGHGVAPEHAEAIFDPRSRGETDSGGLGLGLHVARNIADAHGGHLRLVPADGPGAVFRLTVPSDRPEHT